MTDFFSTNEVAKTLKMSRVAILKKITKGQLKAMKVGRNYIISKEEVLKLLGQIIGNENKAEIDAAVAKAIHEYGDTFKKLGKE